MFLRGWLWVQEPDGRGEETPPESLCFCHQAAEALTRWQPSEKTVTRVIWVFDDFVSSASASFDVDVLAEGRADPEIRSAKRTTLCKALQSWLELFPYHMRCTETKHFLWSLHRKFSGLLVRPWIFSAVADGTVFAWLSWPVLDVCSPSQVLGDVYAEVLEAAYSLHRGPLIIEECRAAGVSFWSPQSALWFCSRSERDSCPGTMC